MPVLDHAIRAAEGLLTGLLGEADPARVRVAWTGGKDSTVALFLWRAVLAHHGLGPARAITVDTGHKFPEIIAFRDRLAREWRVDLHVARPTGQVGDHRVARDVVACCRALKIEPLGRALCETGTSHLISGIRRDEHPDRNDRASIEVRHDPPHIMVNLLLDWTETDIWAFHAQFGLPHCPLYDQGYRSLGCRPCTAAPGTGQGERGGRDQAKERVMRTLTGLGYF
ncbi:phosphoadenosine phosphosulfate reductase family protein [Pseudodesulfovibrio pelocollis]|uniref:phosphoadenosine phosphosulfate reductase family protein n=1 Tax=Pseudodesulfovibrio pelocollis TaxID=3051432 RepID=UPI00255AF501|nr:phosphoadenosine phosphosulfate reductase family protein [Pseudodesulfovibrio sp. SB368]